MTDMAAATCTRASSSIPAAFSAQLCVLCLVLVSACGINAAGSGEAGSAQRAVDPGEGATSIPAAGSADTNFPSLQPGRAVLVEGSTPVRGLPGFGRNALQALAGVYAIVPAEGAGAVRVAVWFTREILVKPAEWTRPPCRTAAAGFGLLAAPVEADGSSLWSLSGIEYTLFVRFPAGFPEPCGFIAVFADRFSFFYRYSVRPEDVSFPAIIELGS